ncbi:hypothetical protein GG344DRAFT_71454 [Lentinula edodes]|nr:hypothetical protein GG344DRAFT_71454 [Lentinula edodes]
MSCHQLIFTIPQMHEQCELDGFRLLYFLSLLSHLRKVTAKPSLKQDGSLSNVEPADSKVRSKQSVHDVSAFFNTLGSNSEVVPNLTQHLYILGDRGANLNKRSQSEHQVLRFWTNNQSFDGNGLENEANFHLYFGKHQAHISGDLSNAVIEAYIWEVLGSGSEFLEQQWETAAEARYGARHQKDLSLNSHKRLKLGDRVARPIKAPQSALDIDHQTRDIHEDTWTWQWVLYIFNIPDFSRQNHLTLAQLTASENASEIGLSRNTSGSEALLRYFLCPSQTLEEMGLLVLREHRQRLPLRRPAENLRLVGSSRFGQSENKTPSSFGSQLPPGGAFSNFTSNGPSVFGKPAQTGTSVFGRTESESHSVFEQPSAGGAFGALKSVSSSVSGAPQAAFRESVPKTHNHEKEYPA